jgi:hypothetical protein
VGLVSQRPNLKGKCKRDADAALQQTPSSLSLGSQLPFWTLAVFTGVTCERTGLEATLPFMGMFNDRCMVTGTCLYQVAAVLLIQQADGSYRPCSPIIDCRWDGYGSVDVERPPQHLEHLALGLVAASRSGGLVVDFRACSREPVAEGDDPATIFKKVVAAIEMDALDDGTKVTLVARRFRVAMIGAQVAKALLADSSSASDVGRPQEVLDWEATSALYRSPESSLGNTEVLRLGALQRALTRRGLEWEPTGSGVTQFSERGERIALRDAASRFINDPSIAAALVSYAQHQYFEEITLETILGVEWLDWE